MERQARWTDRYVVGWHDSDFRGKVHPASVCRFLMETAGNHAGHLQFGYQEAVQRKEIWVIVQLIVKLNTWPAYTDEILIETWPMGAEGFYAFREFRILDAGRKEAGAASSRWMVINAETRKPQPMEIIRHSMHLIIPEPALPERTTRITAPSEPLTRTIHRVAYSEIDLSGHVNNARYVEWGLNAIPLEWHRDYQLRLFQVNYLSEVLYGDTIGIVHDQDHRLLEGIRESDGKSVFKMMMEWKKDESLQ